MHREHPQQDCSEQDLPRHRQGHSPCCTPRSTSSATGSTRSILCSEEGKIKTQEGGEANWFHFLPFCCSKLVKVCPLTIPFASFKQWAEPAHGVGREGDYHGIRTWQGCGCHANPAGFYSPAPACVCISYRCSQKKLKKKEIGKDKGEKKGSLWLGGEGKGNLRVCSQRRSELAKVMEAGANWERWWRQEQTGKGDGGGSKLGKVMEAGRLSHPASRIRIMPSFPGSPVSSTNCK